MTSRSGGIGALVGAVGLCCGFLALLSAGSLGALAGISLGSWVLISLGAATGAFAVWRRHRRRHRSPPAAAGERRP